MYYVTKKLSSFSAAHRITQGYLGKCCHLHGHNYEITLSFASNQLNSFGFVIDFDDIKNFFNDWITQHWDHGTFVSQDDKSLLAFVREYQQKHYLLPAYQTTSVENLAQHVFHRFTDMMEKNCKIFPKTLKLQHLELWETPTSFAKISF